MKRGTKFIVIIGIILACGTAFVLYINKFVVPSTIKGLIVNSVKEKTGYNIAIKNIEYLPLTQFYLKDITVYDKEAPKNSLANIKELSFSFWMWPLLKEKRIIGRLGVKDFAYGATRLNGAVSLSLKQRPSYREKSLFKNLEGVINFANFSVAREGLASDIESITGALSLEDNLIRLNNTFFKYNNTIYNMEGVLKELDSDNPWAAISLNSGILASKGKFILMDDYIKIEEIDARLLGSRLNIMGDIKFLSAPSLNIYGEADLDLADIKKLFPKSNYVINALKPAGPCSAALFYNGGLAEIKNAEASIKLNSKKVFLHGLTLDDLCIDIRMKNGLVDTERLEVRPYHGLLNGSFNLDLNKEGRPYSISFALKDANLAKFSGDMNFGKEDMAGLISSKFFLKGFLASKDTLRGSGWITITDGLIWEMPLFRGVTNLLGIPALNSVVFKEGAGNFIIDNRRISTEDLTFYSEKANLTLTGNMDFDQNLDLLLNTHITQDLVKGSSDAADMANLIISQAGNYIGKVRITGTLKKPKYSFAVNSIEEIFKKGAKNILKEILR